MARWFASDPHCKWATMPDGSRYNADKKGFIDVTDVRHEKVLKAGGYVQAGSTPATSRYWECAGCGWQAHINHCPRCDRSDLTRVGE